MTDVYSHDDGSLFFLHSDGTQYSLDADDHSCIAVVTESTTDAIDIPPGLDPESFFRGYVAGLPRFRCYVQRSRYPHDRAPDAPDRHLLERERFTLEEWVSAHGGDPKMVNTCLAFDTAEQILTVMIDLPE